VGADGLIKNAARGTARFDHNPATGESLGLLVEEARTNNCLRSEELDNTGAWNATAGNSTVVSDATIAPTGLLTGDKLVAAASSSGIGIFQSSIASSGSFVISFFAKAAETTNVHVRENALTGVQATFNLLTGVVGQTNTTAGIIPYGNGWYRCYLAGSATGSLILAIADTTNPTYTWPNTPTRTIGNGIYLWGIQVENGSLLTAYIPTTAATATRAADVATVSNTNSSIFPTSSFTTINSPFGTAGGGSTVKLVGPTIKRTAIYNGDLPQSQINALTGTDQWWRWRVTGATFALPNFGTNGSVTVDWGDGVVETLTTGVHTFLDGNVYHTIGFRLNSGTFFRPGINNNATYKDRVTAVGPAPASMKVDGYLAFQGCSALKNVDGYADYTGGTSVQFGWSSCTSLVSFPLINTASSTFFYGTWAVCSSLISFPLLNTANGTSFQETWLLCSSLTSFPPIDTSKATTLNRAWKQCSGLISFPLITTSLVTDFFEAWHSCTSLISFPLIDTTAGTNFSLAWYNCSGLTSFPLINTGAGTNFQQTWQGCSGLTSFPLINTGAGTNFSNAWRSCSRLTSFPLLSTGAGTNFGSAWQDCTGLTSFPLISTSNATNLQQAWEGCNQLASFPTLSTASVTNFFRTWFGCSSLTSFPSLNMSSGTDFQRAWDSCTSLTTFPPNMFNTTGTLVSTAFLNSFTLCSLTAASIENILTSLVINGQSNITLGVQGGGNAGASTWTANAVTAYNTLVSRGWNISRNA
jgi:hypothetical protein